jgi:hypothetical protein
MVQSYNAMAGASEFDAIDLFDTAADVIIIYWSHRLANVCNTNVNMFVSSQLQTILLTM